MKRLIIVMVVFFGCKKDATLSPNINKCWECDVRNTFTVSSQTSHTYDTAYFCNSDSMNIFKGMDTSFCNVISGGNVLYCYSKETHCH